MQVPFDEPKSVPGAAIPLRPHRPRLGDAELALLFYRQEFAGRLTPAESAPTDREPAPSPDSLWQKMSSFGRWTIF